MNGHDRFPLVTAAVIVVAALAVVVSVIWGRQVQADPRVKLGAAPLVGAWRWRPSLATLAPCVVAVGAVAWLPGFARRARFVTVLAATALVTAAFTFALAAADGLPAVLDPVVHPTEYWANLARLPPAGEMLRRYSSFDFLVDFSVHAKGHPPGFLLVLKALASLGLGNPWVAGALSFAGAAITPVAVLVTIRAVVAEPAARAVAPFLALAPYAVWMGTSADAFFAAVASCGIAAVVVASLDNAPGRRRALAVTGGGLLGGALFLTYGAAMLALLPATLVLRGARQRPRATLEVVVLAAAAVAAVTAAFAAAGFWWFDGARLTQTLYWIGTAQFRPWTYFLLANLAAALIAVGPAVVVGLARLRWRAMWWIVGTTCACIVLVDLSQYSKAEVERIWLLFFPWLVGATVSIGPRRSWLALQAVTAIVLQTWLVSKW